MDKKLFSLFALLSLMLLTACGTSQSSIIMNKVHTPASTAEPNTVVSTSTPSGKPNIVVILTDDQPAGTMWALPKTQKLLSDKGMTLDNLFIPTSACCPSRASLLTGEYAHDTGVYSNEPVYGGWKNYRKNGNEKDSLPVWLHDEGYATGLFGKYMNGYNVRTAKDYTPPGWDEWLTFTSEKNATGAYYNYYLTDGTVHGRNDDDYSTTVLSRRAMVFIKSVPVEQPLFLYFAPYAPHSPGVPREGDSGKYAKQPALRNSMVNANDVSSKPQWVQRVPQYSLARQAALDKRYLASMETLIAVDDAVEDIIQTLEATGRLKDTLIVYMSDNGYMWGRSRLQYKTLPYDGATRVPGIIRWDGRIQAGTSDSRPVNNLDITATIADAVGLNKKLEGYSLLGKERRDGSLLESVAKQGHPAYCGWRTEEYLFVRWATGEEELYNYNKDPDESKNLAYTPQSQETVDELRERTRKECDPTPPGFSWVQRKPIVPVDLSLPSRVYEKMVLEP